MLASVLACACEARPVAPPTSAATGKQAVFGSASLVPTREGERARRELARAGELEQALARLGLEAVHVDVELREPVAVIVIARLSADADPREIEAMVAELTHAMIPELTFANLHLWLQPALVEAPSQPRRRRAPLWSLLVTSIGLGLSLGVLAERLRSRC